MKKGIVLTTLIILLSINTATAADKWSKTDTILEITWQIIHGMDWLQTTQIARNPNKYYEAVPTTAAIIGRHPKEQNVHLYMATSSLIHAVTTHYLPKTYRPYFQGFTITISGGLVLHNLTIGLEIKI